jgi:hypothetical protein
LLYNGERQEYLGGSHIFRDPLLDLIEAVVGLFSFRNDARCEWWDEPGHYCWNLRREGDLLHSCVEGFGVYSAVNGWVPRDFSLSCNLWQFMQKLRLLTSRLIADEQVHQETRKRLRTSHAYTTLCDLLEAHKREVGQAQKKT